MPEVIAYHVIMGAYGFWLPNDPRGSGSAEVRAENLQPFGPARHLTTRRSVAATPHDRERRFAAKRALLRPAVRFSDEQVAAVASGFGWRAAASGYVVNACAIEPDHAHLVMRHDYSIEQVGRSLKHAATTHLLETGLHPFAGERPPGGRLPSVWGQDFRKVFLFTPEAVTRAIRYVEGNPVKAGRPAQVWPFVTPYSVSDAS